MSSVTQERVDMLETDRPRSDSTLPFLRVLVTGGGGFVGRRLVPILLQATHGTVYAGVYKEAAPDGAGSVSLDLTDQASVDAALKMVRPDLIVHLAAQASVGQSQESAERTWRVNVGGSLFLASSVAAYVPEATVLFASSAEVYGRAFLDEEVEETTRPKPASVYAQSKLAAEQVFKSALPPGARLLITRPCNHSGPGQDERFALPAFAKQIVEDGPEVLVGNLSAQRDFLHVDDVADAMLGLLRVTSSLPAHSLFNIASGKLCSIGELLDRMIELSGRKPAVVTDPAKLRPSDIPIARIGASALREITAWSPHRSIDQMLSDILIDQERISRAARQSG